MLPLARQEKLTVRELPDETLVYDLQRNKVHCLNRTSALVWRHCDGRTGVTEMVQILSRELGLPAEEAVVELALEQLQRRDLLQGTVTLASEKRRLSRRLALRNFVKLGAMAAAIPLVMTLTAKPAFAQTSGLPPTPPLGTLCSGVICTGVCTNGTGTCNPSIATLGACCGCVANTCAKFSF